MAVNDAAISAPKQWQLICNTKLCDTLYNFICTLKHATFLAVNYHGHCCFEQPPSPCEAIYYAHRMWLLQQPIMYQNQHAIGLCGYRVHEETYLFSMQTIQMPLETIN